jgi:hypothetical protein
MGRRGLCVSLALLSILAIGPGSANALGNVAKTGVTPRVWLPLLAHYPLNNGPCAAWPLSPGEAITQLATDTNAFFRLTASISQTLDVSVVPAPGLRALEVYSIVTDRCAANNAVEAVRLGSEVVQSGQPASLTFATGPGSAYLLRVFVATPALSGVTSIRVDRSARSAPVFNMGETLTIVSDQP